MEVQQDALADAYAFHYEQLQEQVLDAATICCRCLDDAGVRLLEGGLLEAYAREGECTFASSFEALQDLYAKGQLKALASDSGISKSGDYNIFFALALAENHCAADFFGAVASEKTWSTNEAAARGLTAAISAAKSYMFGVWLKSQADKQ
jgi:hypothetical protein